MGVLTLQKMMQEIPLMTVEQLKKIKVRVSKITNSESLRPDERAIALEALHQIEQRESVLEQDHFATCRDKQFKTCTGCGKSKPVDDSYFGFGFKDTGIPKARCKACYRGNTANHHSNHPEQGRTRAQENQDKRKLYVDGAISEEEKCELRKCQVNKCAYCGHDMGDDGELDHFKPIERGGSHDITNRVWACQSCNRNKGRKLPGEFLLERKTNGLPIRGGGFFVPPDGSMKLRP
jgi:5-methylcytosine-specific restriction endonuclease McrA